VLPLGAGTNARAAPRGIDLGPCHTPRLDQERVVAHSSQRACPVTLGLSGYAQSSLARITDGRRDLICVLRPGHGRRLLVHDQVPSRTRGIPLLVAALDQLYSIAHLIPPKDSLRPLPTPAGCRWECNRPCVTPVIDRSG